MHFKGVGPTSLRKLHDAGYRNWSDVVSRPDDLPLPKKTAQSILTEIDACQQAIDGSDLSFLVERFHTRDHWRVLGNYYEKASYFDIETAGIMYEEDVTVIACYHRGQSHVFVKGENIEEFLDLLDEIELLVSFNGGSFDIPKILDAFRIPEVPCAHIDLRWVCFHQGFKGSLKDIELNLGIIRPEHLLGIRGDQAMWFWYLWEQEADAAARQKLIEYCCADVLSLQRITYEVLRAKGYWVKCPQSFELWDKMP